MCLITKTEALLWTDGRYYIQAEKMLNKDWKMMKMEKGNYDLKTYLEDKIYKEIKQENENSIRIGIEIKVLLIQVKIIFYF